MKKLFATLILIAFTAAAHAQISTSVTLSSPSSGATKTSLSSTDTAQAVITASDYFRSVTVVATKTSSTVAGKAYWYGSGNGTNYDLLDSLTVADVSAAQYKTFHPTLPLYYYKFKIIIYSTSGVWTISSKQLIRQK